MIAARPAPDDQSLRRRSWRLWLAAVALFVQALLPVAVLRAAVLPGEAMAFCSAAGNSASAAFGLDGNPLSDAGHKTAMACPLCAGAGSAALPPGDPQAGLALPAEFAAIAFVPADDGPTSRRGVAAYGSRAPPSFL